MDYNNSANISIFRNPGNQSISDDSNIGSPPENSGEETPLKTTTLVKKFFKMESNPELKKREKEEPVAHRKIKLNPYGLFEKIHKTAKSNSDLIPLQILYGLTNDAPLPFAELHVHLEGIFNSETLLRFAQEHNLFWDPMKKGFRRQAIPTKGYPNGEFYERISAKKLTKEFIEELCCVTEKDRNPGKKFHDCFGPRGQILDKIPLWKQLHHVMQEAGENHIIYRELMFGIYDIFVPQALNNKLNKYEQMDVLAIDESIKFFKETTLHELLDDTEKTRLKRKIQNRLGEHYTEEHFKKLLDLSYVEAFAIHLDKVLNITENELKKAIVSENIKKEKSDESKIHQSTKQGKNNGNRQKLNPNIFDAKSPYTLKLIFEVMRHYSLSEFFAWALSAFDYIHKKNKKQEEQKIVGITVDGPETDPNAVQNFDAQIKIIKRLRSIYSPNKEMENSKEPLASTVNVTYHALEYPKKEMMQNSQSKFHLSKILEAAVADRIGHGTNTMESAYLGDNLIALQDGVPLEICHSTAVVTTGEKETPIKILRRRGVAVTINTDDPGIVGTTISNELIKIVQRDDDISFKDIETMQRDALHGSFVKGSSIYSLRIERNNGVARRIHEFKEPFKKLFKETAEKTDEEFYKILDSANLTAKEHKECQLERELENFKNDLMENKIKTLHGLGYQFELTYGPERKTHTRTKSEGSIA